MMDKTLYKMFSYQRPSGSKTEDAFIKNYLSAFTRDEYLNLVLTIGDNPRILFSSHMDTVHRKGGMNQSLKFDGQFLTQSSSNCLGADDTAGVWLMLQMIEAGIPGVYIIHHAEEIGCVGSSNLARHNPDFFKDIDIAIAFDRMGYNDVITHQMGRETASVEFAWSLGDQLGGSFEPCDNGVYTDTVEYAHLVAECTNISVGYFQQHSSKERQDVPFLMALRDALLEVDWSKLVVKRDPKEQKENYYHGDFWSAFGGSGNRRGGSKAPTLYSLCYDHPAVAADILEAMGLNVDDFQRTIEEMYGDVAA